MSINQPLSTSELAERDRWEQRYGEPLKFDHHANADYVRIGDEYFSVKELERAHRENPQPKDHPFKPHHYLVQEAMNDLKKFYANGGSKPK